jgi:hypothetical protein
MGVLGNSVNEVLEQSRSLLMTVGKAALHSIAPDNFEYYLCSLELLDSAGNTKGFLSFVVMPNNYMETRTTVGSVTKTQSGVTTLYNSTFAPRDISIQGTFGRKLRLLLGLKEVEDKNDKSIPFFNGSWGKILGQEVLVKTGYGLTKMLQKMVEATYKTDEQGGSHILLFSNYSLNTNYVVEVLQDSYSQSIDNNMLWFYSLEMKAVAPQSAVQRGEDFSKTAQMITTVAAGAIAKGIGNILNSVTRAINL